MGMSFRRIVLLLLFAIGLGLGLVGCAPSDPLDRMVSAPTAGRFAAWRSHIVSDSGAETRRRVEDALQEIRQDLTGTRELKRAKGEAVSSGPAEIDEALRQRVDGHSLRDVVQLGLELRVNRLTSELAGLEKAMSQNAQLVTRPGDLESRHHLDAVRERQQVRVETYRTDLAAAERELAPFLKSRPRLLDALAPPPTDSPDEMPERVKAKK